MDILLINYDNNNHNNNNRSERDSYDLYHIQYDKDIYEGELR